MLAEMTGMQLYCMQLARLAEAVWGTTGLFRMFGSEVGTQVAWLIPAALILGVGPVVRPRPRGLAARRATLWLGWLLVTGLTFSSWPGSSTRTTRWPCARDRRARRDRRPACCGGTATRWPPPACSALATPSPPRCPSSSWRATPWHPWLRWAVLVVGFAGAALIVGVHHLPRRIAAAVAAAALVAGLAGPAAYSVATAATPHTGSIPSAGPVVGRRVRTGRPAGGFGGGGPDGMAHGATAPAVRRAARRAAPRAAPAPAVCSTAAPPARR